MSNSGKKRSGSDEENRYEGFFEIIRHEGVLSHCQDGQPRIGKYSYPFELTIPDWLPTSSKLYDG